MKLARSGFTRTRERMAQAMQTEKRHSLRTSATRLLAVLALVVATAPEAGAQTYYWDVNGTGTGYSTVVGTWNGTNAFWNDQLSGTGGTPTAIVGSTNDLNIVAATTNTGTITISGAQAASSITFASGVGAVTMSGGTLALGGTGASQGIFNNSASSQIFSTAITLTSAATFNNSGSGSLSITGGLNLNGNPLIVSGTGTTSLSGTANIITGAGGITMNGGRLTLGAGGTIPAHNYSGDTNLNGGVTMFSGDTGNLSANSNININGGILESYWTGGLTRVLGSNANELRITGGESGFSMNGANGATFNLGASAITWGSTNFAPTKFVLQSQYSQSGSSVTFSTPINLNGADRTIVANSGVAGNATSTLSGILSNSTGTAGLIKEGSGLLILTAANTYNGGTTISAGTLRFDGISTMPSTGNVAVNTGGTLGIRLGGAGNWTTGASGVGTLGGLLAGSGSAGSSTVSYSGNVGLHLNVVADSTYSGTIADVGTTLSLTKVGANMLTLSGSNSYTGGTTITAGTLTLGHTTNTFANTGAVTVNGGTLALGANSDTVGAVTLTSGTISSSTGVLTGSSYDVRSGTISAILGGSAGLTKTTAGSVTISGINTYSGGTNIDAGTLILAAGNNTSGLWTVQGGTLQFNTTTPNFSAGLTMTSGTLAINSAGTTVSGGLLTISGGTISVPNSGTGTVINNDQQWNGNFATTLVSASGQTITSNGDITLGASLTVSNKLHMVLNGDIGETGGSRKLTFTNNGGQSTFTLAGNNSFTGGVQVNQGTLNVNSATALGTGTLTLNVAGAVLNNTSGSAVTLSTNNVQAWNQNFTFTGTNDLNLGTGAVTINSNRTVTVNGGILTVGGAIGQDVAGRQLIKAGAGTLTLSGANTYTGATQVNGGTLQFAKTGSLYNGITGSWTSANINVKSGGTLAFNVGGTNEFTTGNMTTLLTNLAASSSTTNGMNAGSAFGFDTTNASGGTFSISNVIANTTGASGGARGVTKLGTGTLELTGANTYTGATTVSAGTLLVNGNQISATGAVAVNGGTLGGTGTVGGATTVASGGTIRGGDGSAASGTLNVANVTVNSNGTLAATIGTTTNNSQLALGANSLDLKTGSILKLTDVGFSSSAAGTYTLATLTSGSNLKLDAAGVADGFTYGKLTVGSTQTHPVFIDATGFTLANGDEFLLSRTGNNLVLNFAPVPVPEPAAVLGIAVAALGLGRLIRRRKTLTDAAGV